MSNVKNIKGKYFRRFLLLHSANTMELKILLLAMCGAITAIGGLKVTPSSPDGTYILNVGDNFTLECRGRGKLYWTKQSPITEDPEEQINIGMRRKQLNDEEYNIYYLDITNASEHTVGYYACHSENISVHINYLEEEPKSTEDVNYIYIFVNGTSGSFADMKTAITVDDNSSFVVPCRPTVPDAEVGLWNLIANEYISRERYSYNPKIGFFVDDQDLDDTTLLCTSRKNVSVTIKRIDTDDCERPEIKLPEVNKFYWNSKKRAVGENITMTCSVKIKPSVGVHLYWSELEKTSRHTNVTDFSAGNNVVVVTNNLTISDLQMEDARMYYCVACYSPTTCKNHSVKLNVEPKPYLNKLDISFETQVKLENNNRTKFNWLIEFDGYPGPDFSISRGDQLIIIYPPSSNLSDKYEVKNESMQSFSFSIKKIVVEDSGNYTVRATNNETSLTTTITAVVKAPASVKQLSIPRERYTKGVKYVFGCEVRGNPKPDIEWIFRPECDYSDDCLPTTYTETSRDDVSPYVFKSFFEKNFHASGNLTCLASNIPESNKRSQDKYTVPVLLYEVENGFEISGKSWFPRDYPITIKCVVSKYDYTDLSWYKLDGGDQNQITEGVDLDGNKLSLISTLTIEKASLSDSGTYACEATKKDFTKERRDLSISIKEWQNPQFVEPLLPNGDVVPKENLEKTLNCAAVGIPVPTLRWYHDGEEIPSNSERDYENNKATSTLLLQSVTPNNTGKYECVASSEGSLQTASSFINLVLNKGANPAIYLSIIGVICVVFIVLVTYLTWKVRKERRYRMKLYNRFNNGDMRGINPKLTLDEQADKLPYNKKFEFPLDRLIMSNIQLGKGAFGEVYKAEARGIIDSEQITTVAVKKVRPDADVLFVDALISELKILIHMGRHLNVVNLLGACTKRIAERELMVILEYCRYGNLHKYMETHRSAFNDQLSDSKNHLENGQYNTGFYPSREQSIGYSNTGQTTFSARDTNETAELSIRTDGSEIPLLESEKASEHDADMKWRSNYNYHDGSEARRRLATSDLVSWAYQIASGMTYLAKRKILHGDLAARNILLTDDNVAKICDFGLARNIQTNDEYRKESNDPVPIRWLALECLLEKIFSTQSDVWSFGVVLWELFSLARRPYRSDISLADLADMLINGERLEKPKYANDTLYRIMLDCWDAKPALRPSFAALQRRLGDLVDKNERERLRELNTQFNELNAKWITIEEDRDYLGMIMAPDYKEQDQHELELDEDGYLHPASRQSASLLPPNGEPSRLDRPPDSRAPSLTSEPAAPAERDPMLPRDADNSYVQVLPGVIAEEEHEMKAVANPMYHNLDEREKTPHSYVNLITRKVN